MLDVLPLTPLEEITQWRIHDVSDFFTSDNIIFLIIWILFIIIAIALIIKVISIIKNRKNWKKTGWVTWIWLMFGAEIILIIAYFLSEYYL